MLPDEVCGVWGACDVRGNGDAEEVAECSNLELTALHISNMLNAVLTVFCVQLAVQEFAYAIS